MIFRLRFSAALRTALVLCCAASAAASATELVFANGDHLTGKVIKRENGKIYFHSDIVGDLVVPDNQVTVVEPPPSAVPTNSLAGLPPAGAKPPPAAVAPTPSGWWWPWWLSRPLLVLQPVVTHWTGSIEFGYVDTVATTDASSTTLRANAERNVGPDDLLFKGVYLYASSAGLPTTDQDLVSFQWRHNLNERLFTQFLTSYSADKIRLINDDLEQTADIGYKLYATKLQTLDVGGGVMGQYLDATGVEQGADYLGNLFQDYTYKINGRYTFLEDASIQYSPEQRAVFGTISDLATPSTGSAQNFDYKLHATLQGKVTDHLSLNLHFDYEYNNAILDTNARADRQISTTLGYAF